MILSVRAYPQKCELSTFPTSYPQVTASQLLRLRLGGGLAAFGVELGHVAVEDFLVPVGVDVGRDGDVGVAHEFFGDVDGHACPLEVGAERMAQAIGRQVGGQGVLGDDAVLDFCAHV